MATAIDDSYSAASGATVSAGRGPLLPAWRLAMGTLTSAQIGSNTIEDVDPSADVAINPRSAGDPPWVYPAESATVANIISAYSGGSFDDATGLYWVLGGGHGGWNSNAPFSIDLSVDAPAWALRGYPTGSIQHPLPGGQDYINLNGGQSSVHAGRPHSYHTYNLLAATPDGDLWLMPGGFNYAVAWFRQAYRFDGTADDWDTTNVPDGEGILGPTSGPIIGQVGACCYDPVRDCIWQVSVNDCIVKWAAPAAYTDPEYTYYSSGGFASEWGMFYDSVRNWVWCIAGDTVSDGQSGRCVAVFDPSAGTTSLTWLDIPDATTGWAKAGIAFDVAHDRILIWTGGLTLTALTPPASPLSGTWVSSTLTFTGDDPGTPPTEGTFGRFAVSQARNAALIINSATAPLIAFALEPV